MDKKIIFFKIVSLILFLSTLGIGADFELDTIISDANTTNKQVMLFLHKDGCGFCEKMVFDLEEKSISQTIEKNFILVDINRDDDESVSFQNFEGTNQEFLKKLEVNFYPTLLFIDTNSTFIYNVVGYRNKKKLLSILNYIGSLSYIEKTLEEYEDEPFTNKK